MNLAHSSNHQVGIVVIGRNEGVRLKNCIESLLEYLPYIVYVDSGSTDGSSEFCRSVGAHVVELDLSTAFTAGRARNEGMQELTKLYPAVALVQFVDGDCVIEDDWISIAQQAIVSQDKTAIVCGRRSELFPEKSIYNRLCDIEWNTPVGETNECGGDFMVRLDAMTQVNGFDPGIVAGEEPDLCFRLRKLGWRIERLSEGMTLHDADIVSFSMSGHWCVQRGVKYIYLGASFIYCARSFFVLRLAGFYINYCICICRAGF